MTYVKWIAAAALIGSATACVDNSPYGGGSGYGYAPTVAYAQPAYSDGYYQPTYYQRPAVNNYYVAPQPQVVTQTRYVPVPVPVGGPSRWHDRNRDGVPDWRQRDRNHNGIPDAVER
jgi:hypothetical protein